MEGRKARLTRPSEGAGGKLPKHGWWDELEETD